MRPRNPLKLEDCKSREELFDTRIMWFLLEHNEPAKNFRKDGSYVGRLSDYFRDLRYFCFGNGFTFQSDAFLPGREHIEKFFFAFFRGVLKVGSCVERHFVTMCKPPDFLMGKLVERVNGRLVVRDNNIHGVVFKEAFLYALGYRKTEKNFRQAQLYKKRSRLRLRFFYCVLPFFIFSLSSSSSARYCLRFG